MAHPTRPAKQSQGKLQAALEQLRRDYLAAKGDAENAMRSAALATSERTALRKQLAEVRTLLAELPFNSAGAVH